MTTLTTFAPPARRTVVRARMLAGEYGRGKLSTEFFLLALAGDQEPGRPVSLGITAAMVRAGIEARTHARRDRDLLAALGIDLDEVRRRGLGPRPRALMTLPCGGCTVPAPARFALP